MLACKPFEFLLLLTLTSCCFCSSQKAFGLTFESGTWLLCFDSEFELGKFEEALATAWKDLFRVSYLVKIDV